MQTDPSQYPSLRKRLAITLIILAAVFTAGVSSVLYVNFRYELRENLKHRLENITDLAGLQQDGDTFVNVKAQNDEFFQKIHQTNLKIKQSDPNLRFVYTMKKEGGNINFVVDAGMPGEADISVFGDNYQEPSQTLVDNFDSMTGTIVEPDFYSDEFGTFLSAYTPIFTSDGQHVGVLGIDIAANTILAQERQYLFRLILIFLGSIPFVVVGGFVVANNLAKPIVQLRNAAKKLSEGEYNINIEQIPHTRELAELSVDFNIMSNRLGVLINDLEQRVAERTGSLVRKSDQFRAASYIARKTAEIQDLSFLLDMITKLVTDQFGFYHTGIFLISETGKEAVLQAASSEGGRRMIERGHNLAVGKQGIVGYVASEKKPRIALDVGADAVFFNNPDLPMTRSELALPLLIRNKILGVLDIQSDKPQAFSMDDLDVLQTLADQAAVAIENARLLEESQAALSQLEALMTIRTRESWSRKLRGKSLAYTYTPLGLKSEKLLPPGDNFVTIPLILRGQKIGTISVARKGDATINKTDEDLVAEVAIQTGLAIETSLLIETTQKRAEMERITSEITGKINSTSQFDSILRITAEELSRALGGSEVFVQLQPDALETRLQSNPLRPEESNA